MDAAQHLQVLAAEFEAKGIPFTVTYKHGPTLQSYQLVNEMQRVAYSVFMVLSFIKEMSIAIGGGSQLSVRAGAAPCCRVWFCRKAIRLPNIDP